jgi:hypothetical protein
LYRIESSCRQIADDKNTKEIETMTAAPKIADKVTDLTQMEIDRLWGMGYRPYEIYTFNKKIKFHCGKVWESGTIPGWEISFVFSTREKLNTMPFFDAVIGVDSLCNCTTVWHGVD